MHTQESLSLPHLFEISHTSLPDSRRLMRLFGPIIRRSISNMDSLRNNFSMGYWITSQFVGNDLPGFTTMAS
jgi:hypothetical protein